VTKLIFNKPCTFEEIENDPVVRKNISEETIKRAKLFASLLDKNIEYDIIPRMYGTISFVWKKLPSKSSDVREITREIIDITEYGIEVENKCIITTANIGTHEIKFTI
jgi:hypothetical protein